MNEDPNHGQAALGAIKLILALVTIFYCIKLFITIN
jgi:hypothetical protein